MSARAYRLPRRQSAAARVISMAGSVRAFLALTDEALCICCRSKREVASVTRFRERLAATIGPERPSWSAPFSQVQP